MGMNMDKDFFFVSLMDKGKDKDYFVPISL